MTEPGGGKALGDAVLAREPGALERTLTLAASLDPVERRTARDAVEAWKRRTGKSLRVGFGGVEASAIEALASRLAGTGHRVAVLHLDEAAPAAAPAAASPENPFAAAMPPDGRGAADAVRACEIGGYDTILVTFAEDSDAVPEQLVDCLAGGATGTDVSIARNIAATDASTDAFWQDVRQWHWGAVQDGRFDARRRLQEARRDGEGAASRDPLV